MDKRTQLVAMCWMAGLLGVALIVGESVRSYGMGRPVTNWFDDFLLAFFLFFGAYKTMQATKHLKILSAGWAISFTALTMSYASKVSDPDRDINSNLSFGVLTALLLAASITSFVGLVWSLVVDFSEENYR